MDYRSERRYTCCFTGHRPQKLPWGANENDTRCKRLINDVEAYIEQMIQGGYVNFISGVALGADILCAEIVIRLRKLYPHIRLECAIPFPNQAKLWSPIDENRYRRVLEQSDKRTVISPHYAKWAFGSRNRYMVDNSSLLVAVWGGDLGGTANTITMAKNAELEIKVFGLAQYAL